MPSAAPDLSVVVAVRNATPALRACLTALTQQADGRAVEIIVVDASNDDASARIASEYGPRVTLLRADPRRLVPELWSAGIDSAAAPIVALTIGQCVAGPRWIDGILAMAARHERCAGIGGAIDGPHGGRWRDWAVYFSRYSAYLPPVDTVPAADLAGDNAAYRKAALAGSGYAAAGFWETLVHAHVRSQGWTLCLSSGMLVQLVPGTRALQFCRERYQHGRYFGSTRPADSPRQRLVRILTAPAVAPYLLARIGSRVARHRRDWLGRYVWALPWLMVFIACWSTGEALGYLKPRRAGL